MHADTDRELLELAAKAAGLYVEWQHEICYRCASNSFETVAWNPLTDDGDALRLAVKLNLSVKVTAIRANVLGGNWIATTEPHRSDPYAATRRAIVRAAAEIGRRMP